MTYTLTTNYTEAFVFDVATGELISHTSYLPFIGSLLLALPIGLAGSGFWWWYRRSRLQRRAHKA